MERLDKFLSNQTELSRKEARKAIYQGRVTVDSLVETKPDRHISPETNTVCFDGKALCYQRFVYLVMNKPQGVLSASTDKNRQTVVDLVPPEYKTRDLFPVGRLDKDTTGLLILTDDGDFAHKIISPKTCIEKEYIVGIDKKITLSMQQAFGEGVRLADGTLCRPAVLEPISDTSARVILTEGKYHQVKRMLGVFDVGVVSLHRQRIGNLFLLPGQKFGECFVLTQNQIMERAGIKAKEC